MIRRPPTRRVSSLIPLAALLAAASCGPAEDGVVDREGAALTDDRADVAAEAPLDASDIARHTRTLSADSFGGRAPGTPGGEMAAAYIADAFRSAGLEPVDGSWLQAVPMVGSTPRRASASLSFAAGGSTFGGAYLDDFVAWGGDAEAERSSSKGELVFVGYGIVAPEADWNDFEGVDVRGKVLLGLVNDPPAPAEEPELFGGRAMTYYGRWTYKFEEAARQGAAGALLVHVTDMAGYGWNVVESSWSGEQFSLPADSEAPDPAAVQGWITRELATEVLAAAGLELDELTSRRHGGISRLCPRASRSTPPWRATCEPSRRTTWLAWCPARPARTRSSRSRRTTITWAPDSRSTAIRSTTVPTTTRRERRS